MTNGTLFSNLLRGLYAVDGIDGEFIGALLRPIPYQSRDGELKGTLALLPSSRVAGALGLVDSLAADLADTLESALDYWDDDAWVSQHAHWARETEGELDEAEAELAALLG